MVMNNPRMSMYETKANPLIIVGLIFFCIPFGLRFTAFNFSIFNAILQGLGILFFVGGLVIHIADNY